MKQEMLTDRPISIIICSFNRAANLQQTLNALGKVIIPAGWKAELIVVDNASTDNTADVARNTMLANMDLVYLPEPRKGKANALNSGLARARGEMILFTDDDVVPSTDWVEQILACFVQTQCDALVGNVKLAPHLERPWAGSLMRLFLAAMDFKSNEPLELVGANCAFRRSVLERVPIFDPELGPGALGLGEDTLFGWQLMEAGFKIKYADNAIVVHCPDESRLLRGEWLKAARQRGRSKAYLLYHWEHAGIKFPKIKRLWLSLKLGVRRRLQPPPPLKSEGCPPWELSYVHHLALCEGFCIERMRRRNYSRRGLVKKWC
jgi:glycosyltransferase involved in cell wall biosynthesis